MLEQNESNRLAVQKRCRGQIKAQLSRFKQFLNTFDRSNIIQLQIRLEKIELLWDKFNDCQIEIEMLDEGGEQELERDQFEASYFELTAQAKALVGASLPSSSATINNSDVHTQGSIAVKLPELNLPHFDGTYTDYMQFQDTFTALIHQNATLSDVQKLYYLKSCLRGEAANVIQSLKSTDDNYSIAWQLIQQRYENKRLIINHHLKNLFDLPNISKNTAETLHQFSCTFIKEIRCLQSLGEPVHEWASIMLYLLTSKLDNGTKLAWENLIETKFSSEMSPNIEDFSKFIVARCKTLENVFPPNTTKLNSNISIKRSHDSRPYQNIKNLAHVSINRPKCNFCRENHFIYYCQEFLKLSNKDRYTRAKKLNLCINCLRSNHTTDNCTSTNCRFCGKRHNTLLHQEPEHRNTEINKTDQNIPTKSKDLTNTNDPKAHFISAHSSQKMNPLIILSTAIIQIMDKDNKPIKCRCLLDSGSQSNFITKEFAYKLSKKLNKADFPIVGINQGATLVKESIVAKIKSLHNNFSRELMFLVLPQITGCIPTQTFNIKGLNVPENIQLADPTFNESSPIDILLGASIFYELLCIGQLRLGKNLPTLQKSHLGWIISGPFGDQAKLESRNLLAINKNSDIQSQLEKFWTLEETTNLPMKYTKEEKSCEEHFKSTTYRDVTGRFVVSLPLKPNHIDLGTNFNNAKKRFLYLERKLEINPNLKLLYQNFMHEYEVLGHMTRLNDSELEIAQLNYYLPHHGVFKESSVTTKLRVVFDASSRSESGLSLNNVCQIGPTIQDDLFAILLRFRIHTFVVKADIAKMYRQILIEPSQRNLQRILWRSNPSAEIQHYILNTVTYGTSPASFLATRALHQAAMDKSIEFPVASNIILSDFYMDDLLTGGDTVDDVQNLKRDIQTILEPSGFHLTQWMSNDVSILNESERNQIERYFISTDHNIKTLGILWNPKSDCFQYSVNIKLHNRRISKRIILSTIAQIFDPMGLIGCLIIRAKVMLQSLWRLQINWDESVPQDIHTSFFQFIHDLDNLNNISIPRHAFLPTYISFQLHGFSDAAQIAYGACVYVRTIDSLGNIQSTLLCAKSRVAPLKTNTIPRLELCGALILSRLIVKTTSDLKIIPNKIFLWTDSSIVLSWISQEPARLKTFVSNRISEIQQLTANCKWRHVRSEDNPADLISRGCNTEFLSSSLFWWSGPRWLSIAEDQWPSIGTPNGCDASNELLELRDVLTCHINISFEFDSYIFNRYSSIIKLQRIIAFCLRFYNNCKSSRTKQLSQFLTVPEMELSMKTLIKLVQRNNFQHEINQLNKKGIVSKQSKTLSLNPFIDKDGIVRVGGRLVHSGLNFNHKHPVLLPKNHIFTKLVITHEHIKTLHGGVQTVLSSLRTKFWPLGAKFTVRSVIRNCYTCFRSRPTSFSPMMGNLPASRITPSRAFLTCGVDFAGPFMIKDSTLRNRRLVKVYVALFICFTTKAIHLELVGDLSTPAFLNTLKRFFARRGVSKHIYSDNGLNFVGSNNYLTEVLEKLQFLNADSQFHEFLLEQKLTWHFIPSRSPTFGGIWEAAVKQMKIHLIKTVQNRHLTYENFYTILTQIESILNSRPLCPLSNDPNDYDALTPGHFLIGAKLTSIPEEDDTTTPENRLSSYHLKKQMLQHFWTRWSREYLHNLQARTKWMLDDPQSRIKDGLVLLKDECTHPWQWKMGRVVEEHPGSDGKVRVVSVRTTTGIVKRAVGKICILPTDNQLKKASS